MMHDHLGKFVTQGRRRGAGVKYFQTKERNAKMKKSVALMMTVCCLVGNAATSYEPLRPSQRTRYWHDRSVETTYRDGFGGKSGSATTTWDSYGNKTTEYRDSWGLKTGSAESTRYSDGSMTTTYRDQFGWKTGSSDSYRNHDGSVDTTYKDEFGIKRGSSTSSIDSFGTVTTEYKDEFGVKAGTATTTVDSFGGRTTTYRDSWGFRTSKPPLSRDDDEEDDDDNWVIHQFNGNPLRSGSSDYAELLSTDMGGMTMARTECARQDPRRRGLEPSTAADSPREEDDEELE